MNNIIHTLYLSGFIKTLVLFQQVCPSLNSISWIYIQGNFNEGSLHGNSQNCLISQFRLLFWRTAAFNHLRHVLFDFALLVRPSEPMLCFLGLVLLLSLDLLTSAAALGLRPTLPCDAEPCCDVDTRATLWEDGLLGARLASWAAQRRQQNTWKDLSIIYMAAAFYSRRGVGVG